MFKKNPTPKGYCNIHILNTGCAKMLKKIQTPNGSCNIPILNTGCAKNFKENSDAKGLTFTTVYCCHILLTVSSASADVCVCETRTHAGLMRSEYP